MGTSYPSQQTESRHSCDKLSFDAHLAEAAQWDTTTEGSGTRPRAATSSSSSRPVSKQPREVAKPTKEAEALRAIFQGIVTKRDEEIKEHRTKYASLEQRYRKAKESNVYKDGKITQLEEENQYYSQNVDRILHEHLLPYAQRTGFEIPKPLTWEFLFDILASLAHDASEYGPLQHQLQTLQQELLGKVEKVNVASDDHFAREFRVVASLIKTLSRTNRISMEMDAAQVLGYGALLWNVPHRHWCGRVTKKHLLEAWVWSILIDTVFRDPFAVYGEQCLILASNWQSLFKSDHANDWPTPSLLSENWRCTTMEGMLNLVNREVITYGTMRENPNGLELGVIATRNRVMDAIKKGLECVSRQPDVSQVSIIVDKAFALALQMSLQTFRLQITYPAVGNDFDVCSMTHLPDPDGEDIDDGVVAFTVTPGLTKWGDTHGKNFDHRYDIVASLVQLEAVSMEGVETKTEDDYADVLNRGNGVGVTHQGDGRANGDHHESQR